MRLCPVACAAAVLCLLATTAAAAGEPCRDPARALGVARIVEIDASSGPVFGALTTQMSEKRFLEPKEVVLTFDDGPMPGVTRSILDTLGRFCTKATFFSIGRMALAYPELVREVLDRGHTVGTHTWSHPLNLPRLGFERARDQIDSGFAAVAVAAGRPIAPFFRFPGLSDSGALLAHLQRHGVATFTVDVVSNDSYIVDTGRLLARTLEHAEAHQGGILLFHDIKQVTARALPDILAALKARGYRVAHLRAKAPYVPDERYLTAVREHAERATAPAKKQLLAILPGNAGADAPAPTGASATPNPANDVRITQISAPARDRLSGAQLPAAGADAAPALAGAREANGGGRGPRALQRMPRSGGAASASAPGRWITTYSRQATDSGG